MIRDISQPLWSGLPTWPGDTAYSAERTWELGDSCPVNVAKVTMSTHSGTHADAPLHYDGEGASIDAVSLDAYLGPARVIDVRGCGPSVGFDVIAPHLDGAPPRILLRTFDVFPRDRWSSDFTAIAADVIRLLHDKGCVLIGTDAPSIDPETSKTLDAHHAVRAAGMRVLEGLVLDGIPAGDYELIALPLRLQGLDASPVRAILRDIVQ